ncbi:MAG: exosome complex exonuclease Rrp40 [Amphiamblys sp. WSBS2006]|nr:MAG: exosome complex exonuclease Rrp40 [Amphiamblys sp. WSBS2006]
MKLFLPGDSLADFMQQKIDRYRKKTKSPAITEEIKINAGIAQDRTGDLVSCVYGHCIFQSPNRFFVAPQRKYIGRAGDCVVGIVSSTTAEKYHVDIGCARNAVLPYLSFEAATKRKKTKIQIGALVYANVAEANPHLETELSCVDDDGKRSCYGELVGGMLLRCSAGFTRHLLSPESSILEKIGEKSHFETAVGLNGRVWVSADSTATTMEIMRTIKKEERKHSNAEGEREQAY